MSAPKVDRVEVQFSQDEDGAGRAGEEFQTITVKTANGGTEPEDFYLVIETERWAIEPDEKGIAEFVAMLRSVMARTVPAGKETRK